MKKKHFLSALLRISLGWIFLWSFFDKLLGLGFTTPEGKAWVDGVSPTKGFLMNASKGPFQEFFHWIAGNVMIDWLFMIGLLLVGLALMLGIGIRIASWSGALLLFFIYATVLPPEHNPLFDEHIIYIFVLIGFPLMPAGDTLGFGAWWKETPLVKKYPFLR